MTTEVKKRSSTSISIGRQYREVTLQKLKRHSDTSVRPQDEVLLVPGHLMQDEFVVSVSVVPSSVKRKLEIRRINEQLEGRTLRSNTALKISSDK